MYVINKPYKINQSSTRLDYLFKTAFEAIDDSRFEDEIFGYMCI